MLKPPKLVAAIGATRIPLAASSRREGQRKKMAAVAAAATPATANEMFAVLFALSRLFSD